MKYKESIFVKMWTKSFPKLIPMFQYNSFLKKCWEKSGAVEMGLQIML